MSDIQMPRRYDLVGEYDSYIGPVEDGDFVRVEDVRPLLAEIERLREQLHLANIDAFCAHAEANELREGLSGIVSLVERLIDTRRCAVADLRTLNAARAALEAKP